MKLILLITFFLLKITFFCAQKTVSASGGNAVGNGSVNYSIGQLVITTNKAKSGSVTQGVQQSFELFTLVNPGLKALTLKAVAYPNPTTSKIILSLSDNTFTKLTYAVFDIKGKLLLRGKVNENKTPIIMKNMPSGVYLLKVHQNKKQLKIFKIIKK